MKMELLVTKVPEGSDLLDTAIIVDENGITIGRADNNDLVLTHDNAVSKQHAVIQYQSGNFYIYDVSTNGVFLSGSMQALNSQENNFKLLADHDTIRIGGYLLKVSSSDEPESSRSDLDLESLMNKQSRQGSLLPQETQHHLDDELFLYNPDSQKNTSMKDLSTNFDLDNFLKGGSSVEPAVPHTHPPIPDFETLELIDEPAFTVPAPKDPLATLEELGLDLIDEHETPHTTSQKDPMDLFDEIPTKVEEELPEPKPESKAEPKPEPVPEFAPEPEAQIVEFEPVTEAVPTPLPAYETPKRDAVWPSHSESSDSARLLELLFEQVGLGDYRMDTQKQEEILLKLVSLIKVSLLCMHDSVQKRQDSLQSLGLVSIAYKKTGNNPLLFSANMDEALVKLLFPPKGAAYLPIEEAIPECFADLENYQYYLATTAKEMLRTTLNQFSPQAVSEVLCDVEVKRKFFGGKALVNFEKYMAYYDKINEQFEVQLGRVMQKNLEAPLKQLSTEQAVSKAQGDKDE